MSRTDNPSPETEQQQRSAWHGSRDYVSYIVILLNEGAAGDEKKNRRSHDRRGSEIELADGASDEDGASTEAPYLSPRMIFGFRAC